MSSFPRGSSPTLSIREKSLLKRRINKEHSSNVKAGYVHINEEHLHKTGIRGRKRYIIYAIAAFIVVVAVVNILITWTLFSVLRLSKDGVSSFEVLQTAPLLRFLLPADMGHVTLHENAIHPFPRESVVFEGQHGQSIISSVANLSILAIGENGVRLDANEGLVVIDKVTGREVFNTDYAHFGFPEGGRNLFVEKLSTNRLVTAVGQDLGIRAHSSDIKVRGVEGVSVDGLELTLHAADDVTLASVRVYSDALPFYIK